METKKTIVIESDDTTPNEGMLINEARDEFTNFFDEEVDHVYGLYEYKMIIKEKELLVSDFGNDLTWFYTFEFTYEKES